MATFSWKNIIVQRLVRSRHAYKYYKLAPQRKGIATIDLDDVSSMSELYRYWNEIVGLRGSFALLARNRKGQLEKCVGIIRVSESRITIRDQRCALAVRLRKLGDKRLRDMEI